MEKVLILGGGQAQLGLIRKAKEEGLFTIVVGIAGDYPGYNIADKVYNVDINDKKSILNISHDNNIDGICMCCSDYGLETLGYVCDNLNLHGLSEKSASYSSDKLKMKDALVKNGVNTAKFCKVSNVAELNEICTELSFPLMLKAVDLQGSKGIYLCNDISEVNANYLKLTELTHTDYCIIEEYISGIEFGAQAFVYENEILFIQLHGDIVYRDGSVNIPIGHYMPYKDEHPDIISSANDIITKAIKALEFNNCAVNVDLIFKDNEPYIIELTGRAGANQLPELLSDYMGIDYYKMLLYNALGKDSKKYFLKNQHKVYQPVLSRQIFSDRNGVIENIRIAQRQNIKCSFLYAVGDTINRFSNSSDCIGKVICTGGSIEKCIVDINNFLHNDINVIVDGESLIFK